LLAAVVPIPVTVKLDNVKVIRREKEEEDAEGNERTDMTNNSKSSSENRTSGESRGILGEEKPEINKSLEQSGSLIPDDEY